MKRKIRSFTREGADIGKRLNIAQKRRFNWTTQVLLNFKDLLSKTITAWETFEDGEIRYFCNPYSEELADDSWGTYLTPIRKDVNELRDLRSSLQHKADSFHTITNSEQSKHIQTLTVVTYVRGVQFSHSNHPCLLFLLRRFKFRNKFLNTSFESPKEKSKITVC
jgi:hypothetical protein